MNYDRIATILGIIQSILMFLNQLHLIDDGIFEFISALMVALFGVVTNKKNAKIPTKKALSIIETNSGVDM